MNKNLCENCGFSNIKCVGANDFFSLYKCTNCNFYFKPINESNYIEMEEKEFTAYNFNRKKEAEEIDTIVKKYKYEKELNLLEIGCGTGSLLYEFKKKGYSVIGFEPSSGAVNLCKKQFPELNIINSFFKSSLITDTPDIILINDVVEHLDPGNSLYKEIYDVMGMDTILIIKSGNPASINAQLYPLKWTYYYSNQHISFYSKRALKFFCRKNKFKLLRFYKFKHAYGGYELKLLFKNILKGIFFRIKMDKIFNRKLGIDLSNDHFIAVISKL